MLLLLDLLKPSKLVIRADRGGTIPEVCQFLTDLETAYTAIYQFEAAWLGNPYFSRLRFPPEFYPGLDFPRPPGSLAPVDPPPNSIDPDYRLVITRRSGKAWPESRKPTEPRRNLGGLLAGWSARSPERVPWTDPFFCPHTPPRQRHRCWRSRGSL
jgi:hypothetical protein